MAISTKMPRVKFLRKIHARVHFARDAAIVRVDNGLVRIKVVGDDDWRSLFVDEKVLATGIPDGCPTCAAHLSHGYGDGLKTVEECRKAADMINADYDGMEDMARRMAPLLGLFLSGYYVLADMEQFANVTNNGGRQFKYFNAIMLYNAIRIGTPL